MALSSAARRALVVGMVLFAATAAILTLTMPPVLQLGRLVRLVIFHGASTWVNMGVFTLAGLAGASFLLTRREALYDWASGFRYLAVPWWIANTLLGILSSRMAWNSVDLSEPKLQVTFWVMLAAGVVLAVDFGLGRRFWTAAADVLMAVTLWALILGVRNVVHPENPVMSSGWDIKLPFFGIVGSLAAVGLLAAALIVGGMRMAEDASTEAELGE